MHAVHHSALAEPGTSDIVSRCIGVLRHPAVRPSRGKPTSNCKVRLTFDSVDTLDMNSRGTAGHQEFLEIGFIEKAAGTILCRRWTAYSK